MDKDPCIRCDGSPAVRPPRHDFGPDGHNGHDGHDGHERANRPIAAGNIQGCACRTPAGGSLLKDLRILRGLDLDEILAECAALSVAIGRSEYSQIEAGERIPDDFAIFVDAVALSLSLSADEHAALLREFAFAILREELGEELAASILGM